MWTFRSSIAQRNVGITINGSITSKLLPPSAAAAASAASAAAAAPAVVTAAWHEWPARV